MKRKTMIRIFTMAAAVCMGISPVTAQAAGNQMNRAGIKVQINKVQSSSNNNNSNNSNSNNCSQADQIWNLLQNWKCDWVIQNPCKPETPSQKPEVTPPQEPETPSQKPETPSQKPETPSQKPETPSQKPDTPSQKPDNPSQKPDNPSQEPEEDEEMSFTEQVVQLVNEEREKVGLNPVTIDDGVTAAANVRAKETKTSFSHTRPDGTSCFTALKEQNVNYRGAGENIAWGQKTPEAVMEAWMNSSGHRANILNEKFTKIGVGLYQDSNGRNYWAQMFIY